MTLTAGVPPSVQDITTLQNQGLDTLAYLEASLHAIQELRGLLALSVDPLSGRLRILLDSITGSLTLATITTVGTVSTVTTATDVTRINNMGTAAFNNFAGLIPWNEMNVESNFNRSKVTST